MATDNTIHSPDGSRRLSTFWADRGHVLWISVWSAGLLAVWVWLALYLNHPAFLLVQEAFVNTMVSALSVVILTLVFGWATALSLHFLDRPGRRQFYLTLAFFLNLLRSIPQIVGMLLGYVVLSVLIRGELLHAEVTQLFVASILTSLFLFQEVADLIRERINYYMNLDFVSALLVCGVKERTVINREILRKNSLAHLVQKSVAVFGTAIFLVCSVDFIISVGLSMDVSLSNFPVTLGSMLAKIDSKQDILFIGSALSDVRVIPTLFFEHLQGVSVAFLIVFTLLCVYKISNGLVQRYRL